MITDYLQELFEILPFKNISDLLLLNTTTRYKNYDIVRELRQYNIKNYQNYLQYKSLITDAIKTNNIDKIKELIELYKFNPTIMLKEEEHKSLLAETIECLSSYGFRFDQHSLPIHTHKSPTYNRFEGIISLRAYYHPYYKKTFYLVGDVHSFGTKCDSKNKITIVDKIKLELETQDNIHVAFESFYYKNKTEQNRKTTAIRR